MSVDHIIRCYNTPSLVSFGPSVAELERHKILVLQAVFQAMWPIQFLDSWDRLNTVLETPGIPVTGTPSIYLAFFSIYNRWAIYKSTACLVDRRQAIYKCLLSFDLHMHGVTCFKLGSFFLPTSLKTLGGIFVYSLPTFQSDIPEILVNETFFLHSLSHRRYKYRWRSIYLGVMVTF